MAKDGVENEPATGDDDASWRIPTGLAPSAGLQPSPGLAPPQPSSWAGFEPQDAGAALSAEPPATAPPLPIPEAAAAPSTTPAPAPAAPSLSSSAPESTIAPALPPTGPATPLLPPAAPLLPPAVVPAVAPTTAATAVAKAGTTAAKAGSGTGKAIGGLAIGAIVLGAIFGVAQLGSDAEDPDEFDGTAYSADALGTAEQFFDALMTGDTTSAVDLLSDSNLETLAFAPLDAERAPDGQIADVEYGEVSDFDSSATVEVSYSLGGEYASTVLSLEQTDSGWRISNGTVRPQAEVFEGFPVTINGQAVTGGAPALLPGVYELGFSSDAFVLPDEQQRMTIHLSDSGPVKEIDTEPQLSTAGTVRFTEALHERLQQCLDAGTMSTDCGMDLEDADLPEGYELSGGLTRTLDPAFSTVLADHPPQLERDATGFTGRVVLPAEFSARIALEVRRISDGTVRTGHMRDPEASLRPRAYLNGDPMVIEWIAPDAS